MSKRNLYDIGMDIMRQERGLIAWGHHNSVMFQLDYPVVIGLDFMSPGKTAKDNCALMDQAARQLIEHATVRA